MLTFEIVWLRRLYKVAIFPLTGYWVWWEWPLQWQASVIADISGAVLGTALFGILVLEVLVVMVLFVPQRVKQIFEKGRLEGREEGLEKGIEKGIEKGRSEARAGLEKALEDTELSEELKAKILSSVTANKDNA